MPLVFIYNTNMEWKLFWITVQNCLEVIYSWEYSIQIYKGIELFIKLVNAVCPATEDQQRDVGGAERLVLITTVCPLAADGFPLIVMCDMLEPSALWDRNTPCGGFSQTVVLMKGDSLSVVICHKRTGVMMGNSQVKSCTPFRAVPNSWKLHSNAAQLCFFCFFSCLLIVFKARICFQCQIKIGLH